MTSSPLLSNHRHETLSLPLYIYRAAAFKAVWEGNIALGFHYLRKALFTDEGEPRFTPDRLRMSLKHFWRAVEEQYICTAQDRIREGTNDLRATVNQSSLFDDTLLLFRCEAESIATDTYLLGKCAVYVELHCGPTAAPITAKALTNLEDLFIG